MPEQRSTIIDPLIGTRSRENNEARRLMTGTRHLAVHSTKRGVCFAAACDDSAAAAGSAAAWFIGVAIAEPPNPD